MFYCVCVSENVFVVCWDVVCYCFMLFGKLFWDRLSDWKMAEGGHRRQAAPHGWQNRDDSNVDSGHESPEACDPPVAR